MTDSEAKVEIRASMYLKRGVPVWQLPRKSSVGERY